MSLHTLALATALLLVAAAAPSAQADPPRCVTLGCVQVDDRDGDGGADYANGAFAAAGLAWLNVNANRTNVSWWGGFTFEEYEPLHGPDDKALGAESWGHANLTAREGGPGFNTSEVHVLAYFVDHETGELEPVALWGIHLRDSDGDHVPDRCDGARCLALP